MTSWRIPIQNCHRYSRNRLISTRTIWRQIEILPNSSLETFQLKAFNPCAPALCSKDQFSDFPALHKWITKTPLSFNHSYLSQSADTIVPLELSQTHVVLNAVEDDRDAFQRAEAPFGIFLDWARQANANSAHRFYIAQAPISRLPQGLQDDLPTPEIVTTAGKGDLYDSSIWLGVSPTYTSLHRDPNPNLFLQLAGQKAVRLVDPAIGDAIFQRVQSVLGKNTSTRFRGEEMMKGQDRLLLEAMIWNDTQNQELVFTGFEADLEAGDALFIPNGWWHSIRSVGNGITASVGLLFTKNLTVLLSFQVNWWFR